MDELEQSLGRIFERHRDRWVGRVRARQLNFYLPEGMGPIDDCNHFEIEQIMGDDPAYIITEWYDKKDKTGLKKRINLTGVVSEEDIMIVKKLTTAIEERNLSAPVWGALRG